MKKFIITLALMLCATQVLAAETGSLPADKALAKLKIGNERFVTMHLKHPHDTKTYRGTLVKGQHPFAVVVTCSDSRVPAELIFDQGLGDLFVIRNAGNVLDEHVIGSIEYAIGHLGTKLIVIMGHESCGAIAATMSSAKGSEYIQSIEESIRPAIEQARKENNVSAENVTKDNAKLGAECLLNQSEEIREFVKEQGVKVVPAYYHLDSGKVEFLCK